MSVVIPEPFSHRATRVWSKVLEWSWVSSSSDSDVDTVKFLGFIATFVKPFLVENGIKSNSGFTGLPVTNDQFTLTPTDWYERVDTLQSGLHWFVYGFPGDNTWGFDIDTSSEFAVDWAFAV